MDEAQILEGLRKRDMIAFERLYDSLSSMVMFFAEKITKDEQEAEDIAVRAFAKFWTKDLSKYDTMKKVKNFIFKVARNSAVDYVRKQKTKQSHESKIIHLIEVQDEYDIERIRYETEMLVKVYAEIDKLPQRTQEVFKLVYIKEMNSREVGELLQISDVTVRRLCSEAMLKLRSKFSQKELQLVLLLLSIWELEPSHLLPSICLS